MRHFALNVYHWGGAHQDRLLADCLGPTVRGLWDEGLARRFWFHRYDVRGPHVGVFLGTSGDRAAEVCGRLSMRLEDYLAAHPRTELLTQDELVTRHAECRGGQLSTIDAEPGFAPNNSFCIAAHPADCHLLRMTAGVEADEELWSLMGDLAFWSIRQLGSAEATAVRWIASLDCALGRIGEAEEYWRYYATTLLIGLDERLRLDEAAVRSALPKVVGEKNRWMLARAWAEVEQGPPEWAPVDRWVAVLLADDGRSPLQRWQLLRFLSHGVLAQLGQPARLRIPLVLYAWLRRLDLHAAYE